MGRNHDRSNQLDVVQCSYDMRSNSYAGASTVRPLPAVPLTRLDDHVVLRSASPVPISRPLACKTCKTCITFSDATVSGPREFKGFFGKASLFSQVDHITLALPVVQLFVTGAHVCQTACCASCASQLGWKIVGAYQPSEQWKEGTYLLELETLEPRY